MRACTLGTAHNSVSRSQRKAVVFMVTSHCQTPRQITYSFIGLGVRQCEHTIRKHTEFILACKFTEIYYYLHYSTALFYGHQTMRGHLYFKTGSFHNITNHSGFTIHILFKGSIYITASESTAVTTLQYCSH